MAGIIADRQEKNTKAGQLNDVFRMGVELLGHERPAVRQGAICVLGELSFLHPEDAIHVRIMNIFVSYLSYPPEDKKAGKFVVDGPDIAEIARVFKRRSALHRATEREFGFDLHESLSSTIFVFDPKFGGLTFDDQKREEREREVFDSRSFDSRV